MNSNDVWDPKDAFRPGNSRFGSMVIPVARVIRYDAASKQWSCDLGGEGAPIVFADTEEKLRRALKEINRKPFTGA